jgi:hypothetical protein
VAAVVDQLQVVLALVAVAVLAGSAQVQVYL